MNDIKQIISLFNRLESLSKKDAYRIIYRNRRNCLLKKIFEITYNPFLTYNSAIPKNHDERFYKGKQSLQDYEKRWKKFNKIIDTLLKANVEGEKTFLILEKFLTSCNNTSWKDRKEYGFEGKWYTRIVNKNLELISKKKIRDIWPDIKTDFTFCIPITNKKHKIKFPASVEPLYNGIFIYIIITGKRCFVIDDKGDELYNLNFIAKLFLKYKKKYIIKGCLKAKWTKADHEKHSSEYGKLQSLLSIGKQDNFNKISIKEKAFLSNNLKFYIQDTQMGVKTELIPNPLINVDVRNRLSVFLYKHLKNKWKGLKISKYDIVKDKNQLKEVLDSYKEKYYGACIKSNKVYLKKFWKNSSVAIITSIKNENNKSVLKCIHEKKNGKIEVYSLKMNDIINKKYKYHYIEIKNLIKVRKDLAPVSKLKIQNLKSRIKK